MPTTRRRRRQALREPLRPAVRHFFETGELIREGSTPDVDDGVLDAFTLAHPHARQTLAAAWKEGRDEVLPDWIAAHPGTRPHAWWVLDAPEPRRRRLGGIGTPSHEVLADVETLCFGIPRDWVTAWQEAYYNGRSRDVHGNRIGTEYSEGHFTGRAIDRDDPPRFESEAAYLDRHGLLSAAERLAVPLDAFEPDLIQQEEP